VLCHGVRRVWEGLVLLLGGANDNDTMGCLKWEGLTVWWGGHGSEFVMRESDLIADMLTGLFPHRLIICVPVEHHCTLDCDGMDYFNFDCVNCYYFFSSYFW